MLPTIAAADTSTVDLVRDVSVVARGVDPMHGMVAPCSGRNSDDFVDQAQVYEVAAVCAACPVATACLEQAIALDVAYRNGRDRYGITGMCAGVWFEPGKIPRRVVNLCTRTERVAAA